MVRFRRDPDGNLDPDGQLAPKGYEVGMKYDKEARFCFGCALDIDVDGIVKKNAKGQPLGITLPLFEYTESTVVTNTEWEKHFWMTCKAPKAIEKPRKPWVEDSREPGVVYSGDTIDKLPKIGTTMKSLMSDRNVNTVREFASFFRMRQDRRKNIVKQVKGLSMESLLIAESIAEKAPEGPPPVKDHRKANNPYLSRFGKERWYEEVCKAPSMKAVTNVRHLVEYMVKVSKEHFAGTVYENNWYFYHDALSLMTADETKHWMTTKGYYKHWILPENGLNRHIAYYKKVQPVGNNPGAMPWDNSLNKDCDDLAMRHVAATSLLDKDDPKKFSLATPNQVSSTYQRLFNNPPVLRDGVQICPTNEGGLPAVRIGQDIYKTLRYWRQVFDSKGVNINTNTNGHRGNELREGKTSVAGGIRHKKTLEEMTSYWIHPDARDAMNNFTDASQERLKTILAQVKKESGKLSQEKQDCYNTESIDIVPQADLPEENDMQNEVDCNSEDESDLL
jgi:hypothetical protein